VDGRLLYLGATPDEDFWREQWADERIVKALESARSGNLQIFKSLFPRYLPKEGRILEAGCGMGHIVMALRARGYNCEGVEWSEDTVATIQAHFPELPITQGDVTALEEPDNSFEALISLGVVEHREAGPEPFLTEAYRVLKQDGLMLISVPWFNPLRRWKARLGFYRDSISGLPFYQQAFSESDFVHLLEKEGFEIVEVTGYDPYVGLAAELPGFDLLERLLRKARIYGRIKGRINCSRWAVQNCSHMLMVICRKPSS